MSFTDSRLPGKKYKTERGLKSAITALQKRERGAIAAEFPAAPPELSEAEAVAELAVLRQQIAETAIADEAERVRADLAAYTGPIFLRNVRYVPVRLKFEGKDGRTANLKPRGQRGDFTRLQPGEEFDAVLNDVGILFEVLTDVQIAQVVEGQTTNQQAVHPALAHLRTENGEPITGGVVIEEEFTAQGWSAGTVVQPGADQKQSRVEIVRTPQIALAVSPDRAPLMGTQDRPVPEVSGSIAPEDQAAYVASRGGLEALMRADALARQKGSNDLASGLGGLKAPAGLGGPVVDTRFDSQIDPSSRTPAGPVGGQEQF